MNTDLTSVVLKFLLSSTWATNDPLERQIHLTSRFLYLVLWLKWYTNCGEPRMNQHFPLSTLDLLVLSPARMLDKCLEVCRDVFCCLFCFFLIQWFACLAKSCAAYVGYWGNSSFPFIFLLGGNRGRALMFYNPGIVCGYIVNLLWLRVWLLTAEESKSVIQRKVAEQVIGW